jgi:hypothetical protein
MPRFVEHFRSTGMVRLPSPPPSTLQERASDRPWLAYYLVASLVSPPVCSPSACLSVTSSMSNGMWVARLGGASTLIEREAAACQVREAMSACLRREVEDVRGEAAEKRAALVSSSAEMHRMLEALDAGGRTGGAADREKVAAERKWLAHRGA